MDDFKVDVIVGIIIIAIVYLLLGAESCANYKDWNNGYCPCGGNWVYEQAVGHYSHTGYLYHCDSCDNYIEIDKRY